MRTRPAARWICCIMVLFAAVAFPSTVRAQAGPPYQTDDPDPVPYHHWELYAASQDAKVGDVWSGSAPQFEANYGALPRVQLHVLVPLAYQRPTIGPSAYGLGDVEVGAKVQFLDETPSRPMIGTFVMAELPAGSSAQGLATPSVHLLLPLWLQKAFGPWSTDAGGGYLVDFDGVNGDYWNLGWLVQRQLSKRATVGAELYDMTSHGTATASLVSNLGLVFNLTDHEQFLISAGHSLEGERTLQGYVAFYVTGGR